jgi:hypothetical protein
MGLKLSYSCFERRLGSVGTGYVADHREWNESHSTGTDEVRYATEYVCTYPVLASTLKVSPTTISGFTLLDQEPKRKGEVLYIL